ncbi:hypothetical protein CXB51_029333 [Gossypium anomalum]|uniref:Protein kinase domain-containing protein n=1 Tax=Gossypium anomalum TaxID=47600 RepID=A0A8J6CQI2_9ROSI|nr:hypothetical protein CXB51_029333 [Gossypium anomalum]
MADINDPKQATLSSDSIGSGDRPEQNFEDMVVQARHRRQEAMVSSYGSAHELRGPNIEKEKQDRSSPKGVIEACFEGSDSNKNSPDNSPHAVVSCTGSVALSNWKKLFQLWKRRSKKHFASIHILSASKRSRKSSKGVEEDPMMQELYNYKSSLQNFSLPELRAATDNFNRENIIGMGGYSIVYKGCLKDGRFVAVKRATKGTSDEMTAAFLSELGIIAHVNHPNTATLIGCGVEGGMHLVFQLSPFGSLASVLHGSKGILDWSKRYKIALGTADGLKYLHESCERRIIHRDIKAENILLTENFEPQIMVVIPDAFIKRGRSLVQALIFRSFAISALQSGYQNSGLTTMYRNLKAPLGFYLAPEYFMHGLVNEKTDVYAFGVLLLELIAGRRVLDDQQQSIVIWAKPLLDKNDIKGLIDPSLGDDYDPKEANRMVSTASLCIEHSPILRPQMSQVTVRLRCDGHLANCCKKSWNRSIRRTYSNELLDAQEYNSTKHLNSIDRLREIDLSS